MQWFCPVCETVNNVYNGLPSGTGHFAPPHCAGDAAYLHRRCKLCHFLEPGEGRFEIYLMLNQRIDNLLPRHHLEQNISSSIVQLIKSPADISTETTYDYIRSRLHYRNYYINKRWRRKVCYRKFLDVIVGKINRRPEQIEPDLILQWLL